MNINYYEFLNFLFDRDQEKGEWRYDWHSHDLELTGEEVTSFVKHMFDNYDSDLSHYSDWQLALGFEYIFNNSFSDWCFYLRDGPSSLKERIETILALKTLFEKCLNVRCQQKLGHLSERGNELNNFCYMLWDVSPLAYCEDSVDRDEMYAAILEVMEYTLYLSNKSCVESGLHGLGHMEMYTSKARKVVRKFLDSNPKIDNKLKKYAKDAENGYVL